VCIKVKEEADESNMTKTITVEGSLSQNSSRQMLQASSHESWIPPSTNAAADVI